jgi:ribosomal protein S18 acetylase RimI-like enzyme
MVWHSLRGPLVHLAEASPASAPRAARFDPSVSVFAALPDDADGRDWSALAELVGPGGAAALVYGSLPPFPADWRAESLGIGVQMVADQVDVDGAPTPSDDYRLVELGAADADDMLALVRRTAPGPFMRRTVELGRYVGYRHDDQLVAMAGERMRTDDWTEVSAVCTDDEHRGRGLARRLVSDVIRNIRAEGREACLHTTADNHAALALYESMGFARRRTGEVIIVHAP